MKKFRVTIIDWEGEVEAKDEDDVYEELAERICLNNETAENIFWDNLKIKEIKTPILVTDIDK